MGSLFRKKNARGTVLPKWYLVWIDATGRRRYRAGSRDKAASERLLSDLERETARGEMGLADPYAKHKTTPLAKHLVDFGEHLETKGVTPKHRELTLARLGRAFEGMAAAWPGDMSRNKGEGFLRKLTAEGASAKTRNDYLAALSQFARWGESDRRWAENPFKCIGRLNVAADPRRERRALTVEELGRLFEATKTRSADVCRTHFPNAAPETLARKRREGAERSVIYRMAAYSGLRLNELRTLDWRSLRLDGDAPSVTVEAKHAKSRRADTVELGSEVAEHLRAWRQLREAELGRPVTPGERVFAVCRDMFEHFPKDAGVAGIPVVDGAGRVVDFHALRHSYATLLSQAGVAPRVAQALMRHADLSTTMRTYVHVEVLDRRRAVESLPRAAGEEPEVEALQLAAGAESVAHMWQQCGSNMATNCGPEGARGGKVGQEGEKHGAAQNPRSGAVCGTSGKGWQAGALRGNSAPKMREAGLEPARLYHTPLKRTRLPVPPLPRVPSPRLGQRWIAPRLSEVELCLFMSCAGQRPVRKGRCEGSLARNDP